ncbi:MAG: radical SAM protein [Pseudomonadota bacterium]
MTVLEKLRGAFTGGPVALDGPFHNLGENAWIAKGGPQQGDNETDPFRSNVCLYEDGQRLTAAHQHIDAIKLGGEGRFSHWGSAIIFSTTDGSDPNVNGRNYSYDFSLTLEEWERERRLRLSDRWLLHPMGAKYKELGGEQIPPPLIANLGLTNKCNLRCEICGSQKFLDETGVRRRHMAYQTVEAVAETLFPILSQVELNSQGDPLLHPRIESILGLIEKHRCEVKVQHNGTLLSDKLIDILFRHYGTIMLSLDAVGDRLDVVRAGASWQKAKPGLDRLLAERDPSRLSIGVYPTLTKRTMADAVGVAQWALEKNVDHVVYHRYNPIQNSFEESPSEAEYADMRDTLRRWCEETGDQIWIQFEGETLNGVKPADKRTQFSDIGKHVAMQESAKVMFPISKSLAGADPFAICASPDEYVEIGLDGQISACCRSQDVGLGLATSVENFAAAWFGRNYHVIRKSLRRGSLEPYPLPNCEGCVKFFAPDEARDRASVNYRELNAQEEDMRLRTAVDDVVALETIQREQGHCHIVVFPVGLEADDYVLFEDDKPIGPSDTLHDEIRKEGHGRYHLGATSIYFSTSDGTDARRNGRVYTLRRRALDKTAASATSP